MWDLPDRDRLSVIQVGIFKYAKTHRLAIRCSALHDHHAFTYGLDGQQVVTFWIVTSILVVLSLALTKVR